MYEILMARLKELGYVVQVTIKGGLTTVLVLEHGRSRDQIVARVHLAEPMDADRLFQIVCALTHALNLDVPGLEVAVTLS